jgi:hypothetical protein
MESPLRPTSADAMYRMSWTAYVKPVLILLVMLVVGAALFNANEWVAAGVAALALLVFAFNVMTVRSVMLYTDEHGVWVFRGILPWSKGVSGVKWRDLEDAVYFPNFLSWVLRSYTIRVGHRFTKTSEIVLGHIARGQEAVAHINERHRQTLVRTPQEELQ